MSKKASPEKDARRAVNLLEEQKKRIRKYRQDLSEFLLSSPEDFFS